MSITQAPRTEAELLAAIVSESNKDVARQFGLTASTTPHHPSLCTSDWIRADYDRGERYFLFQQGKDTVGCVACEQPDAQTFYLNRLSVLPAWRHQGIGEKLVKHVLERARAQGVEQVSVGIIAAHTVLKRWYITLGFEEGVTRSFDHLPFEVTYLRYVL